MSRACAILVGEVQYDLVLTLIARAVGRVTLAERSHIHVYKYKCRQALCTIAIEFKSLLVIIENGSINSDDRMMSILDITF